MAQATSPRAKASGLVTVFRAVAILTVLMILVQFFLAGWGAFHGVHSGAVARDSSDYSAHKTVGYAIAGLSVVLLLVGVLARLGSRVVGMTVGLLVLAGPIQPILANAGEKSGPAWGALHALVGILILGLVGTLVRAGGAGPR
jgi:hypothetical protein